MTATTISQDDFFAQTGGGGGDRNSASAAFENIGTVLTGTVAEEPVTIQQTEYGTGKPLTFSDGTPRMQLIVVLQTDLRNWEGATKPPNDENGVPKANDADTGLRTLFVKYKLQDAIGDALRKVGASRLDVGGKLSVKYVSTEKTDKGFNAKVYAAKYEAPPKTNASESFFAGNGPDEDVPF